MYIQRHMEQAVEQAGAMFGAVLVSGPRQVGKTTLLRRLTSGMRHVTLDDPVMLEAAVNEPGTFFLVSPPPVFIDEIQYAPNLFPHMKMTLDRDGKKGQFYLSGSQQFLMMQNVSESLAGRLGILNLLGLSVREITGTPFRRPFLPTLEYCEERRDGAASLEYQELWKTIWRGSMPELVANQGFDWSQFYGSYVRTYIERDLRSLSQVGDEVRFLAFLTALAGCTGKLLNLASLARDVGISQPTADRWLSILTTSNLVYLLRPYSNNAINRAVKTPKVYFLDTGLAAYLTRWNTHAVLQSGAMAGPFFETFIVAEIIKSYHNIGIVDLPLYYYRDRDGNEIDMLVYQNGTLFPIEIKKSADPSNRDTKAFRVLDRIAGITRGPGCVICLYEQFSAIDKDTFVIPAWMV